MTIVTVCLFFSKLVTASTILVTLAHPDDETLINGTIHQLIDEENEGVKEHDVYVMYATSGKYGRDVRGYITNAGFLAKTRETEAKKALAILGLPAENIIFLRQDDHLDEETYAERLKSLMKIVFDKVNPEIVITLGPEGIYGHKEHVMVSYLSSDIFNLVSSCEALLYFVISESQNEGYNISGSIEPVIDEAINLEVNVLADLDVMIKAHLQHETQFSQVDIDKYIAYINQWPTEQFILGGIRRKLNTDIDSNIDIVEGMLKLTH